MHKFHTTDIKLFWQCRRWMCCFFLFQWPVEMQTYCAFFILPASCICTLFHLRCLLPAQYGHENVYFKGVMFALERRCTQTRGAVDSSKRPVTSCSWTQFCQHCTWTAHQREYIEGILYRWQRSWSSAAWYCKVSIMKSVSPQCYTIIMVFLISLTFNLRPSQGFSLK